MKKQILLLLSVVLVNVCIAQKITKDYAWEKEAKLLKVPALHEKSGEIILKDNTIVEFTYGKNNKLEEYFVSHTITHVNSDEAIENNNKIYLPLRASVDVIEQKARVITPSGKVIEMEEGDIKEAKIENGTYRYFALRGVEKGSQVESIFILRKKSPQYEGKFNVVQSNIPKYNVSFGIYAPENLSFISKSYNGLENLKEVSYEDKEDEDKLFELSNTWKYVEPLKNEDNASFGPNAKKLIYKIHKNLFQPEIDMVSYNTIAKLFYENLDIRPDKKLSKKIKKLLKPEGISKIKDKTEKLQALENYLKINYPIKDTYSEELEDIESIMKNKVASKRGIVKFYCAILNYYDIEHNIVFTNNRSDHKFDEEFEAYNFLEDYVLYFPAIDKYLSPTVPISKMGFIPFQFTNNFGLFIKPVKIGNFSTAKATIDFIESPSYEDSRDNMYVSFSTADNFKSLDINYGAELTGYYAQNWQPIYDFVDDAGKERMKEAQIKFLTEDLEIKKTSVENATLKDFGVKPYIFKSEFTTKSFIERAGDKILLKIGEMIGPQVEMYQEEKRKLPVENQFNRHYHREITFTIPDNYTAAGFDALKFNEVYNPYGTVQAQFVSDYTIDDKVLKVTIDEYYNKIEWSADLFDEYRRIINAAADFNKVVLYLEKK